MENWRKKDRGRGEKTIIFDTRVYIVNWDRIGGGEEKTISFDRKIRRRMHSIIFLLEREITSLPIIDACVGGESTIIVRPQRNERFL